MSSVSWPRWKSPLLTTSKSKSLLGPICPRAADPNNMILSGLATSTIRLMISFNFIWDTVFCIFIHVECCREDLPFSDMSVPIQPDCEIPPAGHWVKAPSVRPRSNKIPVQECQTLHGESAHLCLPQISEEVI